MNWFSTESDREANVAALLDEMKATAAEMRSLIIGMPPLDLLGISTRSY